ncbi:DNA polymerase IV [Actinoplanes sp. NPDC026670]|uniref:DNA polymerase IV n=1 Tax=Actinoplanes sp. NPDC026670 TaxID=3154700 RepID=UPI003405E8E9
MRREASILHVDLDAMFAAVEQRDKPSLRGKPVIVGGVAGRGVVSTASYEARAFGAHSAMPMAQARRRCPPNTAFLSPRFPAYQKTSAVVMELLGAVSPLVEQVSIDEAYIDLAPTGNDLSVPAVTALALRLKSEIAAATGGVTGSIGAASSKLLAKIGSDLYKPAGLTVVPPGDELLVLHPLPVRRLGGVGPATEQRLHRSGIRTVGDLAAAPLEDLVDWFGTAHGHGLFRLARADDPRPVVSSREAKSVSAEETFDIDVRDPARLTYELDLLSARVAGRLRRNGLTGRTVNIKVRHPDFTTVTRAVTRDQPTDDGILIAQLARRLLAEVPTAGGIRLLGVGVSTLYDFAQDDLFSAAGEDPPTFDFPTDLPPVPSPSVPLSAPSPSVPSLSVPSAPSAPSLSVPSVPPVPSDSAPPPSASSGLPLFVPPGLPASTSFALIATEAGASAPAPLASGVLARGPGLPVTAGEPQSASNGAPAIAGPVAGVPATAVSAGPSSSATDATSPAIAVSASSSSAGPVVPPVLSQPSAPGPELPIVPAAVPVWRSGQDVRHDEHGPGWVHGSGVGRVTVRFEGPSTPIGRVRTFFVDDPQLHPADPPDWTVVVSQPSAP